MKKRKGTRKGIKKSTEKSTEKSIRKDKESQGVKDPNSTRQEKEIKEEVKEEVKKENKKEGNKKEGIKKENKKETKKPSTNALESDGLGAIDSIQNTIYKVIGFIENNRAKFLWGVGVLLLLLVSVGILSYMGDLQREEISNKYYEANLDLLEKVREAGDEVVEGGNITDDELAKLVKGNKEVLEKYGDEGVGEVYLSQYTLGLTYYSIEDYDNAIYYFREAYKNKEDFYLSFQALLNLGHSLYNRGYNYYKKGEYKKAEGSYKATLKTYKDFNERYKQAPSYILSNRYLGLLEESFAQLYKKMGKSKKEIKEALKRSEKHYEEYLKQAKHKSGKLEVDFMSNVYLRRGVEEDANLLLRGVKIKLAKLS